MRLASYRIDSVASWGVVIDQGIVDVGRHLDGRFATLRSALEGGALAEVADYALQRSADLALDAVAFDPVIPSPDKVFCVGVNYVAHRLETGRDAVPYPTLFTRFANTLVGHGGALVRPRVSSQLDFEAEMAVIIG